MKKWITSFDAEEISTGRMATWSGDTIEAHTFRLAQEWCGEHKPWLRVIGELVFEAPIIGDMKIDFDNGIDYENIQNQ